MEECVELRNRLPVTDLVALEAIHGHPWQLMTTAELAAALDVDDDEAAARIAPLMQAGYLSGPMQYRSTEGEWSAIGFKLTDNGRCLLGVEAVCDGWARALKARDTATSSSRGRSAGRPYGGGAEQLPAPVGAASCGRSR